MDNLVSIIIPNYNTGKYLGDAVDSVLAQTYQNLEIIIVDDCSTEDQHYDRQLSKDSRIRLVKHAVNKGLPASRNTGITVAAGPVIQPLDADDKFRPEMVEKSLNALEEGKGDVVYTNYQEFGNRNRKIIMRTYDFESLIYGNQMCSNSMFWKNHWKEVGGYNEAMYEGLEDWEFWINMGKHGHFGYNIPEILFDYRIRGDSLSDEVRNNKKHERLFELIKSFHPEIYGG